MPIEVQCPCGKILNAPDEYAGRRIKCQVCGELLTVPQEAGPDEVVEVASTAAAQTDESFGGSAHTVSRGQREMTVSGRPAITRYGITFPALFGSTRISLESDRVVEETRGPLSRRHAELRLSYVDSVEISTVRFPLLFVLGLATLAAQGLGLVFLAIWVFVRTRCLTVRTASGIVAVRMKASDDRYYEFKDAVMSAAGRQSM